MDTDWRHPVQTVETGGPASDILVQFEGKPVDSIDALHKALDEQSIGRTVSLWVLCDGNLKQVSAVPGELK